MMNEWNLCIKEMSWVENTGREVDFIIEALHLSGSERILDLACGFGRHSLELSRRGYTVTGVDITPAYIDDAKLTAEKEGLEIEFIVSDVLDFTCKHEFDVVINMADGAIGYFPTEEKNLKLFDIIAHALKKGGKHVMGVCNADHAEKYFPKRSWEAGSRSLSLADFRWNPRTRRMIYKSHVFRFNEVLHPFDNEFPRDDDSGCRLYSLQELKEIFKKRNMRVKNAYADYTINKPATEKSIMLVVCSEKERE
jgi:SAM-dependent methyltransferase